MLLLLTDRPDRSVALAQLLEQIAPCRVSTVQARFPGRIEAALGLVADIDLLQPEATRSLRTLRAAAGGARTPLICLMRSMGTRSLAAARNLGAELCLPGDTPVRTVAQAVLAHLRPAPTGIDALVARSADEAGTVITGLLDAARSGAALQAAAVDEGLTPVLTAVESGGLDRWLATVRSYDDATYQHCLLVTGLAATFAIDLGFSERDRQQIVRAALVHDVGKARIPRDILNKPGRLGPAEQAVMRSHAATGHDLLVEAGGFDALTLDVVRHHHEALDGSGYPDGLAGGAVSDPVRLVTICDIYAALVESRPYRTPMPSGKAVAALLGMEDKLDPALVRAFARSVSGT
jgi:putative nucleotidyltransferase with HDIG domain